MADPKRRRPAGNGAPKSKADGPDAIESSSTAAVERELLAALGWAGPLGVRHDVDLEWIRDPVRRRIAALLLEQMARHGATSWSAVYHHLAARRDDDALVELVHVTTGDGWIHVVPVLLDELRQAADRRQRIAAAIDELRTLGVNVELDGAVYR